MPCGRRRARIDSHGSHHMATTKTPPRKFQLEHAQYPLCSSLCRTALFCDAAVAHPPLPHWGFFELRCTRTIPQNDARSAENLPKLAKQITILNNSTRAPNYTSLAAPNFVSIFSSRIRSTCSSRVVPTHRQDSDPY
jgi:hypothetical protein